MHGTGEQTLTDGAATAMPALVTVRIGTAAEMMALHHAFKAAAFRSANGVHKVANSKQRWPDNITRLDFL